MTAPDERPAGCHHWTGRGWCGATPTRRYLPGRRCADHAPTTTAPTPAPETAGAAR